MPDSSMITNNLKADTFSGLSTHSATGNHKISATQVRPTLTTYNRPMVISKASLGRPLRLNCGTARLAGLPTVCDTISVC